MQRENAVLNSDRAVNNPPPVAEAVPLPRRHHPALLGEKMLRQGLIRRDSHLEQSESIRSELATLAYRINKRCKAFFAHLLGALDESRRREAARIFRQYKHLIDENVERDG
jgi:hypothetical protein